MSSWAVLGHNNPTGPISKGNKKLLRGNKIFSSSGMQIENDKSLPNCFH